jgi:hypothetical protein
LFVFHNNTFILYPAINLGDISFRVGAPKIKVTSFSGLWNAKEQAAEAPAQVPCNLPLNDSLVLIALPHCQFGLENGLFQTGIRMVFTHVFDMFFHIF